MTAIAMPTASVPSGVPSREVPGRPAPVRRGRAFLILPLFLVNAAAVWGQAGWANTNLHHGLIVAVLFALAVESIGAYLAFEAHEALMADQASGMLRMGSYGVGLLAGTLNYLHFVPEGLSTAVAFGCLSAVSPWLWAIWSRATNRARLAELGMVDVRAVKLGTARKVFHPVKSFKVVRWAAWEGITSPQEAVEGWQGTGRVSQGGRHAVSALEAVGSTREQILELRELEPALTQEQIAQRVGCTSRWVRKVVSAA